MRGAISAIRFGVSAKLTSLRRRVWRGGSCMTNTSDSQRYADCASTSKSGP